jgi:predicted signal transduction protein with EAL and GGDEF domain
MTSRKKIMLIGGLVFLIGFLHYSCQLYLVQHNQIHNVILKFFYIPIVMASFWWGVRGGVLLGFSSALIYSIDVFRWKTFDSPLLYNDIAEMILFAGIGILLGWMVQTDRRCRMARIKAEERAEAEFRHSITDPLTQIFNRRFMDQVLKETWQEALKGKAGFSLLMIDLDHFKQINDHYGHPTVDQVLQTTA